MFIEKKKRADNLTDDEVEGIDIPQCTPLVYTLHRADLRCANVNRPLLPHK